jgi:hypothetical protein
MKKQLLTPVDFNGQTITHVLLREPNAAEYLQHGEVYIRSMTASGQFVSVENDAAIAAYLDVLIVEPKGLPLVRVSLADGMRLKDAVLDFFGAALKAGSPPVSTVSSEASDGSTPLPSAAPA